MYGLCRVGSSNFEPNKIKSPCVIFYGDDEVKKSEVKLRNLKTGEELSVKIKNLVNEIKKIIWKNS